MDEQPQGPLPQARWSLEHAVAVLHQNGLKLKPHTLSKFEGGIEFEVYSVQDSYGQSIVFKYPSERWVYKDNDYGIDRMRGRADWDALLIWARIQRTIAMLDLTTTPTGRPN